MVAAQPLAVGPLGAVQIGDEDPREAQCLEIQELGLKGGKVSSRQTHIRRPNGRLIGFDPPDFQTSSIEAMMPVMVMPVVVMTPVVVARPAAIIADPSPALIAPDSPAAEVR